MSVLNDPVLVLNKSWLPVGADTVCKAIGKLFADKCSILCPDTFTPHSLESWISQDLKATDKVIKTASFDFKVPEVIVVKEFNSIPKQIVHCSRKNLWKRDKGMCQYCSKKLKTTDMTIDHLLPKSRGGKTCFENCVISCIKCNVKKDNKTPVEAGMKLKKLVRTKNGIEFEVYTAPKIPHWSPAYAIKKNQNIPPSWGKFVQNLIDDLYWNIELET